MRSPITLLQEAINIFTSNIKLFFLIFIIPGIISIAATFYLSGFDEKTVNVNELDPLSFVYMPIVAIAFAIAYFLMGIAMIKAVSAPKETDVMSAYGFALNNVIPYLIVSILVGIAVVIGFILFIIPGIIAIVWFSFSYFVLFFEGKRGIAALKGSKAHVDGHWWGVFGRLAFLILLSMIISFIVGLITGFDTEAQEANPMYIVLSQLINFVVMPISMAYTYLLYLDLRSMKEGASSAPIGTPTTSNQGVSPTEAPHV